MRIKINHRINLEIILKLVFLFGFTAFYFITIKENTVSNYVHPRIIPYMCFAMISFLFIALFMVSEIFRIRKKNTQIDRYIIFLLPVLTAFILPPKSIVFSSDKLSNIKSVDRKISKTYEENEIDKSTSSEIFSIYSDIIDDKESSIYLEDGKIILNEDNFINWIDELYINSDRYEGNTIELIGFVLKNNEFKQNEFVIARSMMVCCAADTQAIGFLCNYDKASQLEEGSWIKINGEINIIDNDDDRIPLIDIQSIKGVDKPENEFIYPY
ncbi:TIGR03943 family putative permease subunit [Tissierella praeacuta]|uniref:TIGR03943 family putative permease subunit n=1 Tax=Tissierella praeacuta TaxID=43131 RepID=UPI001C11994B|nr:TIGR03943 family protein [Tissierella praeacuta]MBU5256290.1 TIGR03943 family protein [Tissierella praeacuta]